MPTWDQASYRGRNDDGSESTATWKAAENGAFSAALDTPFRIRFVIQNDGTEDPSPTPLFQLQYRKNGGAWANVDGVSLNVRVGLTTGVSNGTRTTSQLASGSGSFLAGGGEFDGGASGNGRTGGFSQAFPVTTYSEDEFGIVLRSADLTTDDLIELRVLRDLSALDTYTEIPQINGASVSGTGSLSGGGELVGAGLKHALGDGSLSGGGSLVAAGGQEAPRWRVTNVTKTVDLTPFVRPIKALRLSLREGAQTLSFALLDPESDLEVDSEDVIRVEHLGQELFEGRVKRRTFARLGLTAARTIAIECSDYNLLLVDDVIDTAYRTVSESDKERITWLVETFGTKGITVGDEVQELLAAMPDGTDGRPEQDFSGKSLGAAIAQVSAITGGRFYVDSDKRLHYFATEVTAAPFAVSDAPNNSTTFRSRNFVLSDDSVDLVHRVLVRGAGVSVTREVGDLPASPADIISAVINDDEITSVEQAEAAGDAFLAAHVVRREGSLEVLRPGVQPGMTLAVTNARYGLADEPFRVVAVDVGIESSVLVRYALTLGSQPADLGSLIGGASTTAVAAAAAATETQRIIADLSVAGANLLPNSSFEASSLGGWSAGAGWVFGFEPVDPQLAFFGTHVARLDRAGVAAGALSTPLIPVDRTDDYWVSYWSFLRAISSGSLAARIVQYDAATDPIAGADIDLGAPAAAETAWTRRAIHLGANDQLGRIAFHADAAFIGIVWDDATTGTFAWDVDGGQVERGKLLTAYAPAPGELADGAITETMIADDAITTPKLAANSVVAGKVAADTIGANEIQANAITTDKLHADAVIANVINAGGTVTIDEDGIDITDEAGSSVLDSAGFQGAWADFLDSSIYNNRFLSGADFEIVGGQEDLTSVPFWEFEVLSLAADRALRRVTSGDDVWIEAEALTAFNPTNECVLRTTRLITVTPGARFRCGVITRAEGATAPARLNVNITTFDAAGAGAGSILFSFLIDTDEADWTEHSMWNPWNHIPDDAVAARVSLQLEWNGTPSANDLIAVRGVFVAQDASEPLLVPNLGNPTLIETPSGSSLLTPNGAMRPYFAVANHFASTQNGTSYPDGISMMSVSSAAGWPGSGTVVTFAFGAARVHQLYMQAGATRLIQYRQWNNTGSAWTAFGTL